MTARVQRGVVLAAGGAVAALAFAAPGGGWRLPALVVIGAGLGMALYHGAFGFTSAWRAALRRRETAGIRAQIVMIAIAMVLFAPVLAAGGTGGRAVAGALAPADLGVGVGAFLFGLGMQLASGCGSGILFTLGGGGVRMVATLAAFCAGGFWATFHFAFWRGLPGLGTVSLPERFGTAPALAGALAVLGALWLVFRWLDRAGRDAAADADGAAGPRAAALWRGPWPPLAAALALALLNLATLVVAGHPWTITWGFTLWGAKAAAALGWDPAGAAFWADGFPAVALARPLLADTTSLMNLALVAGAALAAGLAGRFRPGLGFGWRPLAGAVAGGLLMGYGARLAYGCNIGAFFSGVASQSLHGWLWVAAAAPGAVLGVWLRPLFGYRDRGRAEAGGRGESA